MWVLCFVCGNVLRGALWIWKTHETRIKKKEEQYTPSNNVHPFLKIRVDGRPTCYCVFRNKCWKMLYSGSSRGKTCLFVFWWPASRTKRKRGELNWVALINCLRGFYTHMLFGAGKKIHSSPRRSWAVGGRHGSEVSRLSCRAIIRGSSTRCSELISRVAIVDRCPVVVRVSLAARKTRGYDIISFDI